ncbi:MAG: PD40 domain-containing protein [Deltaproteobacteria bacterium]|nr:PD40 domain-containing protein [Deltaproteobacteria bacterium]
MPSRRSPLLVALTLVSCASGNDSPPSAASSALANVAPAEAVDVVELDRRADGIVLLGSVLPAPENADPDRVVEIAVQVPDGIGAAAWPALDGRRALDARFLGDGSIAVLDTDHALRIATTAGHWLDLDVDVEGPLSVAGTEIVYVRGEMPDLEVARADAATGVVETLTHGMAPAWSPAISSDGRAIVFVSGRSGSPRLYRWVENEGSALLPHASRFPTSPRAPRLVGSMLSFEDETGPATVDLATGRVVEPPREQRR